MDLEPDRKIFICVSRLGSHRCHICTTREWSCFPHLHPRPCAVRFPWFFGVRVIPADAAEKDSGENDFDYSANAVFAAADFPPLAAALQDLQDAGKAPVVTARLVTVRNEHWGVPAGIRSDVTFVYLSRVGEWERQLTDELRALVVPANQSTLDYGHEIASGPFALFPNYRTGMDVYSPAKANLLADLAGWSVLSAADMFRDMLEPGSDQP